MLILACVLVALLTVPLTGGRLSRLGALRWRRAWLLLAALLTQVVVIEVPGVPQGPAAAAHVLTYGLAGAFVWANRSVAGLWLLALGAASNGVTIALNGGTLPSTHAARATAGLDPETGFENSGVLADPVLLPLGDVFAVPAAVPLANVFSVGDVLIVAGAWWLLWSCSRVRPLPDAQPDALPDALPRQASAERTADSGTSIQDGRFRVS